MGGCTESNLGGTLSHNPDSKPMKTHKHSITALVALILGVPLAATAQTTILVNDTWADGDRTSSGTDGTGIDSAWYSSTGTSLTATTGSMTATVASASSLTFWTYFTASGSPVQLAVGDTLQVTMAYNVTGPGAQNTSRAFNFRFCSIPPSRSSICRFSSIR